MPLEVKEEKSYEKTSEAVFNAAIKAIGGLEGKLSKQDAASGSLEANFDKKILGKVLGERTYLSVQVKPGPAGGSSIAIEAYPLDPVGRKLMFGARKGVTQTVVTWFFAHLEHHLGK